MLNVTAELRLLRYTPYAVEPSLAWNSLKESERIRTHAAKAHVRPVVCAQTGIPCVSDATCAGPAALVTGKQVSAGLTLEKRYSKLSYIKPQKKETWRTDVDHR